MGDEKMDMALDDLIKESDKDRRGRGGGRGGRRGGRGNRQGGRGDNNNGNNNSGGLLAGRVGKRNERGGGGGGGGGRRGGGTSVMVRIGDRVGVRNSGGGGGGGGAMRNSRGGRNNARFDPYKRPPKLDPDDTWQHDMFQEVEGGDARPGRVRARGHVADANGNALFVENLEFTVNDADLKELFSEVGPVQSAKVDYDRSGRSSGVATVVFSNPGDARRASQAFNGVELDGKALKLTVTNKGQGAAAARRPGGQGALFSAALRSAVSEQPAHEPQITVRLGRTPFGKMRSDQV